MAMPMENFVPVLQTAVGPVILISGVSLLLLTLTNRFGRAVDRARLLMQELRGAHLADRHRLLAEVKIIYRRARLIQAAIVLAAVSILCAAMMITVLFLAALLQLNFELLVSGLFVGCLLALVASVILFLADIQTSLKALKLELDKTEAD